MDKLLTLFDFSSPEAAASWGSIDDRVMGGVSNSAFLYEDSSGALFTGEVSMEHGGGFASVRSGHLDFDLSDYQGLAISFMGDGNSYKLSVTTEPRFDSVIYRAIFNTKPGVWEELKIPFGRFVPTFRGEIVPGAPELDPSPIVALGLLISQRQKGPFRLKVSFIKAYRQ
ncbi:MAG: CIA30 family protein [bacterium]|nr:CIA30 family protein [bacterium]MDT8367017.1 CIA30 family protein [bacterium]